MEWHPLILFIKIDTYPSTSTLPWYMKVDGMAPTHSLCKRDRGKNKGEGLSPAHPRILLVCVNRCNGIHSPPFPKEREREREREKERESKVTQPSHSFPLYMRVDGMAFTHSGSAREVDDTRPSTSTLPFYMKVGGKGIHSLPLLTRSRKNIGKNCHQLIHSFSLYM